MAPKQLNEILLNSVLDGWKKQAYLQGWDFDMNIYKSTCELFKRTLVAEKIYKGGTTSKILIKADANCAIHGKKQKRGEAS